MLHPIDDGVQECAELWAEARFQLQARKLRNEPQHTLPSQSLHSTRNGPVPHGTGTAALALPVFQAAGSGELKRSAHVWRTLPQIRPKDRYDQRVSG
jgi:hypothetical protein